MWMLIFLAVPWLNAGDIRTHRDYKTWVLTFLEGTEAQQKTVAELLAQHYGPKAAPLVPALRVALRHATAKDTLDALTYLCNVLGHDAQPTIPELHKHFLNSTGTPLVVVATLLRVGWNPTPVDVRHLLHRRLSVKIEDDSLQLEFVLRKRPAAVFPVLLGELKHAALEHQRVIAAQLMKCLDPNRVTPHWRYVPPTPNHRAWLTAPLRAQMRQELKPFTEHENHELRCRALLVLMMAEPSQANAYMPSFVESMAKDDTANALNSLRFLPPTACAYLVTQLGHGNPTIRNYARRTLSSLTRESFKACWPALRVGLRHANPLVPRTLLQMLEDLPRDREAVREAVVPLLDHPAWEVRYDAANWLVADAPTQSAMVLPVLREQLADGLVWQRATALRSVERMGSTATEMVPLLLRQCRHPHKELRMAAAHALAHVDPRASATYVPIFVRDLQERAVGPSHAVLGTLTDAGRHAHACLPTLRALLKKPFGSTTRIRLAHAILAIDSQHDSEATAMLTGLLKELLADAAEYRIALDCVQKLGPRAKACLPILHEQLKDETHHNYRPELALCILHVDPAQQDAMLDVIRRGLTMEIEQWLPVVRRLGSHAKPLVPLCVELAQQQPRIEMVWIELFSSLGSHAVAARPLLMEWAKVPGWRDDCHLALRQIAAP